MSEQSPEQPIPSEPTGSTEPEPRDTPDQDDQTSRPGTQAPTAGTADASSGAEKPAGDTGTPDDVDTAGVTGAAAQHPGGETRDQRGTVQSTGQSGGSAAASGRRVTRRTVHRRESEETTEETITEDLPVYQGPTSTHPAPVG